ncbi:enhanced intracellular survival protein Eis [Metabacillus herbersteinensis]|uniref:Enhanced intracellular survival protein Eis n=1 Tax=Metabacillus herbersteinensis TaxID=283816 RepID=A0ABV6GPD2_9BACI
MIRVVEKQEYDQVLELSQYAFQYSLSNDEKEQANSRLQNQYILGDFEEEKLTAKLQILSFQVIINETLFKMGGVASVATWPEERRNRKVAKLIDEGLNWMKENGYHLSYLHPFSIPFYRQFGYELICSQQFLTIQKEDLQFLKKDKGRIQREKMEQALPLLKKIYGEFSKSFNSMLVREDLWWENSVIKKDASIVFHYNPDEKEDGYMIYKVNDRKLTVYEIVTLNEEAKRGFWNFVCQHDSMVDEVKWITYEKDFFSFYLANPRVKTEIHPYFMARIIDVESFLSLYPFQPSDNEPLILHVYDPVASWNNGTYFIENNSVKSFKNTEKGTCVHPPKKGLQIEIGILTALLLGYKKPSFLYKAGMIKGDLNDIARLEKIISGNESVLFDFF